jgi:CRP-like cAMP-binding protein
MKPSEGGTDVTMEMEQYDVLDEIKERLQERIAELEPSYLEYTKIQSVLRKMDPDAQPKRGRPVGGGHTQEAVLSVVRSEPGLKIAEIADRVGIQPNYLYRVLPQFEERGLVRSERRNKKAPRWFAAEGDQASNGDVSAA